MESNRDNEISERQYRSQDLFDIMILRFLF